MGTLKQAVRVAVAAVEREQLTAALYKHDRNVSRAARTLGISRKSMQTKMKEYGLRDLDDSPPDVPLPEPIAPPAPQPAVTLALAPPDPPPTWEPGTPLPEPPAIVGTRWIRLERDGGFALVDEDLHPMLSAYRWRRSEGGYAASGSTFLHHLVVGRPSATRRVDHINRNRLDDRRKNLRFATCTQNALNKGPALAFGVDA